MRVNTCDCCGASVWSKAFRCAECVLKIHRAADREETIDLWSPPEANGSITEQEYQEIYSELGGEG